MPVGKRQQKQSAEVEVGYHKEERKHWGIMVVVCFDGTRNGEMMIMKN